ncbi:MAG: hypothetical protein M3O46_05700 [Myxococcota bacterium]|nr:hypothetical protein [Myxococcota bacterium]
MRLDHNVRERHLVPEEHFGGELAVEAACTEAISQSFAADTKALASTQAPPNPANLEEHACVNVDQLGRLPTGKRLK